MQSHPHRYLLIAALCALLSAALFLPGLGGGFLLDDQPTITENPVVQVTTLDAQQLMRAAYGFASGGGSRALPMLTFALDHWRAGLDPAAFKATNIAIHALTMLALAGFLRLLLTLAGWPDKRAGYAAIALAMAWAIHPLQVSSVLYIVQRMQTLGTLFLVLALLAYLKMRQTQIAGQRSRQFGVLAGLCWALALASKEDSILLPAYTLALEWTVLRFRAAQPGFARTIRTLYWILGALGLAVFLFYVLPREWSWAAYPGRDFSTPERLLTQCRVLAMYLGQILWPQPSHMTFYYDNLQPSRSLLQPWTTLPALLLILGLLALAWHLRHRRPLFSLGLLLFFAGHAIASNVIGLELAFEHRNHFPLIGMVLATGDLLMVTASRLELRWNHLALATSGLLLALGSATVIRAQAWGSPIGFFEYETKIAPTSVRAWNALCIELYRAGGGATAINPNLDRAIATCSHAASLNTKNVSSLTYLLTYKTVRGSITKQDWQLYLKNLDEQPLNGTNSLSIWILIRNARGGIALDEPHLLRAIDVANKHYAYSTIEYASLGYFILGHTAQPERAYRYFTKAILTSMDPSFARGLISDLEKEGKAELASRLQALAEKEPADRQRAGQ